MKLTYIVIVSLGLSGCDFTDEPLGSTPTSSPSPLSSASPIATSLPSPDVTPTPSIFPPLGIPKPSPSPSAQTSKFIQQDDWEKMGLSTYSFRYQEHGYSPTPRAWIIHVFNDEVVLLDHIDHVEGSDVYVHNYAPTIDDLFIELSANAENNEGCIISSTTFDSTYHFPNKFSTVCPLGERGFTVSDFDTNPDYFEPEPLATPRPNGIYPFIVDKEQSSVICNGVEQEITYSKDIFQVNDIPPLGDRTSYWPDMEIKALTTTNDFNMTSLVSGISELFDTNMTNDEYLHFDISIEKPSGTDSVNDNNVVVSEFSANLSARFKQDSWRKASWSGTYTYEEYLHEKPYNQNEPKRCLATITFSGDRITDFTHDVRQLLTWKEKAITTYSFTYQQQGFVVQRDPWKINVENNRVVGVTYLGDTAASVELELSQAPTIESLFNRVMPVPCEVTISKFDQEYGFPNEQYFECGIEGYGFTVSDFEPSPTTTE